MRKLIPLAFLAPDLQARILDGRQPRGLTLKALLRWDMPADWNAQRQAFEAPPLSSLLRGIVPVVCGKFPARSGLNTLLQGRPRARGG